MPTIWRDKVTVKSLTFNDPLAKPIITSGVVGDWGLDVLLGWHDTPEVEAEFAAKGLVDGEVPAEFFPVRGRQLSIGGYATSSTRAGAEELYDAIVRDGFPRNEKLTLVRYEGIPKQVDIYRNGPISCVWTGPENFRWAVSARATDPFKYALTPLNGSTGVSGAAVGGRSYPRTYPLTYTGSGGGLANGIEFNVPGTADTARIVVEITGPLTRGGWRISNDTNGDFLKLDVGLALGDTLLIDFEKELAYVNGSAINVMVTGEFFRLGRGVNELRLYADFDPSSTFEVTAYPAWE
jgi:hypothetical protein